MKKLAILILLVFISCAARISTLTEPSSDESMVVLGSVILQNNGFTSETEVYVDGIDVLIVGKTIESGKEQVKDYWVVTDKNGYFILSDVPAGEYALKAIRTTVGVQSLITIANSLRYSSSEFEILRKERIPFGADYFAIKSNGRVLDLQHNFFMIDYSSKTSRKVLHRVAPKVKEAKLVNNEIMVRTSNAAYFIEKYPESQWIPVLKNAMVE